MRLTRFVINFWQTKIRKCCVAVVHCAMQCATHWLFLFGIFGFLDRKKWIFRWKVLDFLVILFEFSVIFLVFWVNSFWISHPSHASSRGSHSLSARRGRKGRIQAGPKGPMIMTLCQSQLHSGVLLLWPDVAARGLWVSDSAEQWTGTLPSLCCLGGRIDDQMIRWSNGGRTDDQMVKWWQDSWPDDQMVGGQMITTNTDHTKIIWLLAHWPILILTDTEHHGWAVKS